jgi:hypothetical protein
MIKEKCGKTQPPCACIYIADTSTTMQTLAIIFNKCCPYSDCDTGSLGVSASISKLTEGCDAKWQRQQKAQNVAKLAAVLPPPCFYPYITAASPRPAFTTSTTQVTPTSQIAEIEDFVHDTKEHLERLLLIHFINSPHPGLGCRGVQCSSYRDCTAS